jgi:DNA-binding NtrC family response regulator
LAELGCGVVGPATSVAASLSLLDIKHIDLALIDLTLEGELGLPVADALVDRGIPFAFITGYGSEVVRKTRHAEAPFVPKPFPINALKQIVHQLANSAAPRASERPQTC